MTTPTIVYMGTPDFAVPTLEALDASPFELKLVVTQPDRPRGRGRKLAPPPVKTVALARGYEVVQPKNVRDAAFVELLEDIAPDFLVVVAFGQILPVQVLGIPRHGPVNVHGSLLPRYRGPAPIQWAIMRGEETTGITTILMDHGVDTGDMLLKGETPITREDTAQTLHDRLANIGAELLVKTISGIMDGSVTPRAQKNSEATYAPMLTKENGRILWQHDAAAIDAQIRALTPWPGAFCTFRGKRHKVHRAVAIPRPHHAAPGSVVDGFPDELRIATGGGLLSILDIQGASGKRMPIKAFLHGNPVKPGELFE